MNKNKLRFKAIQHIKNIIKGKKFVVADTCNGLILYERKDYDKVVEGLGYVTPVTIAKFRSFKSAAEYLREKSKEQFTFGLYGDFEYGVDLGDEESWAQ